LQKLRYAMRVLPGLLKWIRRPNLFTLGVKRRTDFVDRAKVPELPVLDLDDQQATTRMKNQEVRVLMRGTYRNVVPADVVIFQVRLEPPREAALAGGHPAYYA
jgi:hypothetical protein